MAIIELDNQSRREDWLSKERQEVSSPFSCPMPMSLGYDLLSRAQNLLGDRPSPPCWSCRMYLIAIWCQGYKTFYSPSLMLLWRSPALMFVRIVEVCCQKRSPSKYCDAITKYKYDVYDYATFTQGTFYFKAAWHHGLASLGGRTIDI